MADDADKTEEPTGKRLSEARNKGTVGKSQDLSASMSILSGACLIWLFSDKLVGGMRLAMTESFRAIGNFEEIPGRIFQLAENGFHGLLWLIMPFMGTLAAISVAVSLAQVGFLWTLEPLGPHFGKVFSMSGLKKIISPTSLLEIAKSVAKMTAVGVVAYRVVVNHYPEYLALADMSLLQFTSLLFSVSLEVVIKSTLVLFFIGVADLVWQKRKVKKELRMSKQEVKDEARNSEGDPHIKGKIKGMRMQMHKNMMMKEVPKATVVITNPTFIAIAIRYTQGVDPAPVVVAKGKRIIAERIRALAKDNDIPIVEDKPLARGLFEVAEPGEAIPQEFFAAVAEILAYVYSLKGERAA
ncbi:MAG TPA: flagellar biosynthesis protein FlhB [Fibrobacteria bacterium]|nr:flagellar biosynthesis protein FlhB [Fibrobacteria bacterium]